MVTNNNNFGNQILNTSLFGGINNLVSAQGQMAALPGNSIEYPMASPANSLNNLANATNTFEMPLINQPFAAGTGTEPKPVQTGAYEQIINLGGARGQTPFFLGNSKVYPTISPMSGLNNLQAVDMLGTPDIKSLSTKEIGIVFKSQIGAYDQINNLDIFGQLAVAQAVTDSKGADGADVLLAPVMDEIRNSPIYEEIKQLTGVGSGLTSRDLFQAAVSQSLDPILKIALFLRAQAKQNLLKGAKENAKRMQQMMAEDPGTTAARKAAEEADRRAQRAVLGLDEKSE